MFAQAWLVARTNIAKPDVAFPMASNVGLRAADTPYKTEFAMCER
jgi:hypothetical protein